VDTVDIEDISEKAVFCRCWRSENVSSFCIGLEILRSEKIMQLNISFCFLQGDKQVIKSIKNYS